MKIFIDTDTFADAPAVYADAEKTQALPRVLPLVQGFKGQLTVGFLGSRAPSKSARAIFAARPLGAKTDVVQSPAGVYYEATGVPAFLFDITADTTQLADALGDKESLAMRAGVVVEEEALCLPARVEWQLTLSASATALGGEQPEPRPSAADELRSEIASEKLCRAAADEALREAIAAESACRESGQVRVDSKFDEVDAALAEKADAADAVLLAAADSAEKNAASKHGKAALLTVNGGDGGVYISGLCDGTRADEKWIAKARHDGVRVYRAPGEAPENFGYYPGACFCAGDVIAREKNLRSLYAAVCASLVALRDELAAEVAEETEKRAAADAKLCWRITTCVDERATCLRNWAASSFVCVGATLCVGYGRRINFEGEDGARAVSVRFTDSPTGGTLGFGSAATDAALALMSSSYVAAYGGEFVRLYAGDNVAAPTSKIEANAAGVILAAGASFATAVVLDDGRIQVKGAPLSLCVGPVAASDAATKRYVDAADAALCARICKIEQCGASTACALPAACVDARIANAVGSEAACRAAADADLLDALDAETACRKSELLRVDSKFNGLADALDAEVTAREKAVSAEAACRVAADAKLCWRITTCVESSATCLRNWAASSFVCIGASLCVGYGRRINFEGEDGARAVSVRFTDSPTGGTLGFGSASTDAALALMSSSYVAAYGGEFVRLYAGDNVAAPTSKIEANAAGVILAAGASFATSVVLDDGRIQVKGAPLSLCVGPVAANDAATKRYVDAADAALCARICKIEKCGASTACALPAACVDARIANAVGSEAACRAAADAALQARADEITAESAKALSTEIQERQWADEELCRMICTERVAREEFEKAAKACLNFIVNTELPGVSLCIASAVCSEAACRAAADAELLDALDAETACRKSEILRVDSKFNGLEDALGAEVTAREKAVSAEAACRVAADACLRKCIGGRDSAVRALCGTVSALRTCVNVINTNVGCVYPTIPKICSKLGLLSSCASRLDSRVAEIEAGGDADAKIAAEKSCRVAADKKLCAMIGDICLVALGALDERVCALDERVCALERSTEIDVLRNSINAVDNRVFALEDELDALDARVEALEGGGGGGGDAKLAGDNVWTGTNRFVIPEADFGVSKALTIEDGASGCIGGGILFEQKRSLFPSLFIAACYYGGDAHGGRVMIPNPSLCRQLWETADLAARASPGWAVPSAVVLSSPKSLMIELVTQSEFDAVPTRCKTCHSLYFILCGSEPL